MIRLQFDITADPLQGSIDKFDKEKGTLSTCHSKDIPEMMNSSLEVLDDKGSQSNIALVDINVDELEQTTENQKNRVANTTEEDIS